MNKQSLTALRLMAFERVSENQTPILCERTRSRKLIWAHGELVGSFGGLISDLKRMSHSNTRLLKGSRVRWESLIVLTEP
jgi:hypothetical protein